MHTKKNKTTCILNNRQIFQMDMRPCVPIGLCFQLWLLKWSKLKLPLSCVMGWASPMLKTKLWLWLYSLDHGQAKAGGVFQLTGLTGINSAAIMNSHFRMDETRRWSHPLVQFIWLSRAKCLPSIWQREIEVLPLPWAS